MARPRLLLIPEFTEVQWTIRSLLEEWGEVRSYDPPGVGDEPPSAKLLRQAVVARGLEEVDRAGWDRFFLLADAWAIAAAAQIAERRREAVLGLALGHACLSYRREGEGAPIDGGVVAAMGQLISNDAPSFIRHGIVQATRGSVDEEVAEQIMARVHSERMAEGWAAITADEPFGETLKQLDCPMLLAQHEGCLISTEEGFEEAVRSLPNAERLRVPDAPSGSPAFAEAVRGFCLRVAAGDSSTRPAGPSIFE